MVCKKCNDTGWFKYDDNHSTVCDLCCKHDKGVWLLTKHHGNPGKWCCLAGCGKTWSYKDAKKKLMKESNHYPIMMKVQNGD